MQVNGNTFRKRRFLHFLNFIDSIYQSKNDSITILDVGGTIEYWEKLSHLWSDRNFDITIINIGARSQDLGSIRVQSGNACSMPEFSDGFFDVVMSNSVIEHVGPWEAMSAMAREIQRVGKHYYVQTPYLWFPIEPHYRSLFFALLPVPVRARKLQKKKLGFRGPAKSFEAAMIDVQSVNLLDAQGLTELFAGGNLYRERFFGFIKSLIVFK